MDLGVKQVMKIGAFTCFGTFLLLKSWKIHRQKQSYRSLESRSTKIKNADDIKDLKHGENGLFKVKITKSEQMRHQKPIHYNEYYFCQPSDLPIVKVAQDNFNSENKNKNYEVKSTQKKPISIKGTGELIGDVFTIERKYDRKQIGAFKKVLGWIAWGIQSIFYIFKNKARYDLSPYRRPEINGPQVGSLTYFIQLLKDSYVIIQCKMVNGELVGELIAESKGELLNHYYNKISSQYFLLFLLFSGTLITGSLLLKDIKRWINISIAKKGLIGKRLFWLEDVEDGKECIICYTNNRNIIFFDCRHMVMCYTCSQTYRDSHCPICKSQIDQIKVVYEA